MNRRDLFTRTAVTILASGLVLPSDEQVRRFWPGWGAPKADATNGVVLDGVHYPLLPDPSLDDLNARLLDAMRREKMHLERALLFGDATVFPVRSVAGFSKYDSFRMGGRTWWVQDVDAESGVLHAKVY